MYNHAGSCYPFLKYLCTSGGRRILPRWLGRPPEQGGCGRAGSGHACSKIRALGPKFERNSEDMRHFEDCYELTPLNWHSLLFLTYKPLSIIRFPLDCHLFALVFICHYLWYLWIDQVKDRERRNLLSRRKAPDIFGQRGSKTVAEQGDRLLMASF